jgi:hypothetical protein
MPILKKSCKNDHPLKIGIRFEFLGPFKVAIRGVLLEMLTDIEVLKIQKMIMFNNLILT